MKIMPINKISFKASLCTNFDFKDKKSNFWPGLVDYAKTNRREEVLEKLEGLLQDVYENTDDDIILALEKYENRLTPLYILAAYDNEEKIIKDRKIYTENWFDDCVGRIKDLNSITKSGILTVGSNLRYSDGSKSDQNFRDIVDAVIYALEEFKNKDSKVYKSLVGNRSRNLSSEDFIRQFGKKIK